MERTAGESSTWNTALSPNAAGSDQRPLLPGSPVRKHSKKNMKIIIFVTIKVQDKSMYFNPKSKINFFCSSPVLES